VTSRPLLGGWGRWWLAAAALLFLRAAAADDFAITGGKTRLVDGSYLIDAQVEYRFTDEVLEALDNGVPLWVELHVQVRREGAWVWEADLVDLRLRSQIRYSPLSATYQVINMQNGVRESFATRAAALKALGEVKGLSVVRADQLKGTEKYVVEMRAVLDIEALPLPLRPLAYLSPAWNLSSEWSAWPLRP
jgi:hypothetical protein